MKNLTLLFSFVAFVSLSSIQAQNSFKIVNKPYIHQQIGCDATDGFQIGEYVYLIEEGLIVVVDVSNPADMEMVSGIEVKTSHHGYSVLNEQYLTMGEMCINISNPKKPSVETCTPKPKKETPTVSYELGKKGLLVKCKVERGVEILTHFPLPEVEVLVNRYGIQLFQINENLLAIFYDNLHFVDVSSPEDPQIIGTYTYNIPNAPRTSVSAMQIYDEHTLCVFTNCGVDFIDFRNMAELKLKGTHLFGIDYNWFNYEKIIVNAKEQHIIYVQMEEGAEGFSTGKISVLKHQNFQFFEEETSFQTTNGYRIQYIKSLKEKQPHSFFLQLDRLIAIDNYDGKIAGELMLGNRLLDFDINEHYVFACGRNEYDSKMVIYQNNGNGQLQTLNVIRDDYRNACITANDSLLVVGGNCVGGEGYDFQVYDLLNVLKPELIFDSKPITYNKEFPPLAYNSLALKNNFLIADVTGHYEARGGNWFTIHDLSNPQNPQLTQQIPCKAYYHFFQFDNTDFWLSHKQGSKSRLVHLAYPTFKNSKAEVVQLEYENFETMTKDPTIEASVRKSVKMLYDWGALPKPKDDYFPYNRLSVYQGFVYELQRYKGMRIYKVSEYKKRFEEKENR